MDSDYGAWKFWLDLAQWLATVVLALYVWIDRGRRDNRSAIESIKCDIDAQSRRVLTLEEHLKHAPTHDDIGRVREELSGMRSKLDRVTHTIDLIHDYLMNKKD